MDLKANRERYYLHGRVRRDGYGVDARGKIILMKSYHRGNKRTEKLRNKYGYIIQLEV